MRRVDDGRFGPLTVRQLDTEGAMRVVLRPAQSSDGRAVLDFRLDAERWTLPFGPKVRWSEVRANGRIDGNLIEVSSYSLAGFYGVTSGMLYAATDVEWVITGRATGTNIDIETVIQHLRNTPSGQEPPPPPFQGTAALDLTVVGRGAYLGRGDSAECCRWAVPGAVGGAERNQSWPGGNAGRDRRRSDPLHRVRRAASAPPRPASGSKTPAVGPAPWRRAAISP